MTVMKEAGRTVLLIMILILAAFCTAEKACAGDFAECKIPVVCRVCGDIPPDLDIDFTYTLQAAGDSPMPEGAVDGSKTVHMTDSGTVDFGTIRFDKPDVFYYNLMETTEESGKFRRDRTEYHAALMADSEGNVKIVINTDKGTKTDKVIFTNSYGGSAARYSTYAGKKKRIVHTIPRTGDENSIIWLIIMLALCSAACMALMIRNRALSGSTRGESEWSEDFDAESQEPSGTRRKLLAVRMLRIAAAGILVGIIVLASSCQEKVYAEVSVTNDYSDMPVNNVEIKELNFDDAEFTSLDSRIKKGSIQYVQDGAAVTCTSVYWVSSTAPKYGSSNATAAANANLGSNKITGDIFTFRFSNAAVLYDGTEADVLMTFSDLYFGLSKNTNGTTGSKYYYPLIKINANGSAAYCNTGIGTSTKNSGRIKVIRSATRIKTKIQIVWHGTDECVGDMEYILGFRDFDVTDHTAATGDNIDRFAGHYSEGVGLISGFYEPVYLCEDTFIRQDIWDNVTKLRGTQLDDGTIASGADISVNTSGFEYYWYGSHYTSSSSTSQGEVMGTKFGYSPKVDVFASAGSGGTVEKAGVHEYILNASTSYAYTPSEGYFVKDLVVDGEHVAFSRTGGTYVFSKLTETSEDTYDHTIEVVFQKPQDVVISKNVKGPLGDRNKEFEFTVSLSGLEPDWLFEITQASTGTFTGVGPEGTRVSSKSFRSSSDGEAVLYLKIKDDQYIRLSSLTGGSCYTVTESASDHIPSYNISGDGTQPLIKKASYAKSSPQNIATLLEKVDDGDGMVTVLFTNEKGIAAPTGLKDRRLPYIMAAGIITLILALYVAVRCRKAEQELIEKGG